jgi:nitrogen-specific signal transduction histidine kinase
VIYDVTAAKRQEAELREWSDRLESRVAEEVAIRQQAEEALRQAQKMEAVGQLTGGIAHDFNNLLMAVMSSLALLRKRLPADPATDRLLDSAMQGAERGAALTQRMLAFARRQDLTSERVDISALVTGMRELVERTLGPAWSLNLLFDENLPFVLADSNQLEMAVLNLAVNARDAMPQGALSSFRRDCATTVRSVMRVSALSPTSLCRSSTMARAWMRSPRQSNRALFHHEGRWQGDGAWALDDSWACRTAWRRLHPAQRAGRRN